MMRKKLRKGFTLVELLVVIVIIAILSAALMLSATDMAASAEAGTIINNLTHMKMAMINWYMDNRDRVQLNGETERRDGRWEKWSNENPFFEDSCILTTEVAKYLGGAYTKCAQPHNYNAGWMPLKGGDAIEIDNVEYFIDCVRIKSGSENYFVWLVGCHFDDDYKLIRKLAARAKDAGLYQKKSYKLTGIYEGIGERDGATVSKPGNANAVWMIAIDFSKKI